MYTAAGDHYQGRMKKGVRSGVGKVLHPCISLFVRAPWLNLLRVVVCSAPTRTVMCMKAAGSPMHVMGKGNACSLRVTCTKVTG